ncbi:MAG: phosphotransferase [Bdellovibrionales bacterium]|nr:phosphotransferase [Bdellovibrionales bacterium]
MKEFLKVYFKEFKNFQHEDLKGDGGHRNYTRIKNANHSFILMSCGLYDLSLKKFIKTQNRLKAYVKVPQLFQYDLKKGLLLLEDLGNKSLESIYFRKGEINSLFFYQKALKQLIQIQSKISTKRQDPSFDKDFFLKEIEQAICDIEKYLFTFSKIRFIDKKKVSQFNKEFQNILEFILREEDFVFCHRDYHSRNLMLKNQQIYIIDFQDSGKGPWFYDLTSLLYDSYIPLKYKKEMSLFYLQNLPPILAKKVKKYSHLEKMIQLQFLQRGFKACGRFCAFKLENNKNSHLKYVPRTLNLLRSIAHKHSYKAIADYAQHILNTFSMP